MPTFMNTRSPLIENSSVNPLDVIKIKSGLSTLGHYEAPQWGMSEFPDRALFRAIRDFQKSQGIKVDGVLKPEGKTLVALQSCLRGATERTATQTTAQALQDLGRNGDEILAHLTQGEAQLLHDITDGGSINPATGLLEFSWYDYESDAAGVGSEDDNRGPDGSGGGNDNGNGDNGPSFLDNFIEDVTSIFNGTANSPHSANDVRNADAMYAKDPNAMLGNRKVTVKDFLRGGYFGPGGGGYSPSAHYNAGRQAQAQKRAARAQKLAATAKHEGAQNNGGVLTTKAAPTRPHVPSTSWSAYFQEQKPTQAPAAAQSVLSPTKPTPVTALSTNETADLKAELAQAEMAAWSSSATPAEQARTLKKLQDLRDKIKKAEAKEKKATESQNQKAANVGEQPFAPQTSKPTLAMLGTVTNSGNEFAGVDGNGTPISETAYHDLNQMALASKANWAAANVGEQPISGPEKQVAPELSTEAAASNDRLAETLAKTTDLSTAADYINDALKTGGPQAQLEVNDLVQSLEDLQPGQGQKLAELVGMALPQNNTELTETTLVQDQKAANVGEQPVAPVLTNEDERLEAIIGDTPAIFNIESNPNASGEYRIHELSWLGNEAVEEHNDIIEKMADKYGVDSDIVRAVMWAENARGHYGPLNAWADLVGVSNSALPMNMNKETGAKLLGLTEGDLYDPETNIEAGTAMLSRIIERVEDPTDVSKIGSLWNFTGREITNDFGEFIGRVYAERPWGEL